MHFLWNILFDMQGDIIQIHDKQFKMVMSEKDIKHHVESVAEKINSDFKGQNPIVIIVLKGACIYASDLIRMFDFHCEIEFVQLSSYEGTTSTGIIHQVIPFNRDISGRSVLIIEDIIDTGLTMKLFMEKLERMNPEMVKIAVFLLKNDALKYDVKMDYVALEIPNKFVVGYGLDYNQHGRNLKGLYELIN